jgi:hypothetical protein
MGMGYCSTVRSAPANQIHDLVTIGLHKRSEPTFATVDDVLLVGVHAADMLFCWPSEYVQLEPV